MDNAVVTPDATKHSITFKIVYEMLYQLKPTFTLSTGKCGKQKTLHTAEYFLIINQVSIHD